MKGIILRIINPFKSNKYRLQDNSFCFARRLQTSVNEMISNGQSAHIEGCFIGINARLVLDVYDYCTENNSEGLLLFPDFEKAFDSVE